MVLRDAWRLLLQAGCPGPAVPSPALILTRVRDGEMMRAFLYSLFPVINKSGPLFSFLRERGYRLPLTFHPLTIRATSPLTEDSLAKFDLKVYARHGAEARIAELTAELNDIY
jgi:hypothetical protein